MKRQQPLIIAIAIGLSALNAVSRTNDTVDTDHAYATIAAHNIFNLKPAATAVIETPTALAPPQITLTGIMSILGPRQVLFKVNDPNLPGRAIGQNTYLLNEGQSQDNIEVCHINYQAERVTFNNHGVMQDISLVGASNSLAIVFADVPPVAKTDFHPADFERSRMPDYLGGGSDPSSAGEPFRNKTPDERILMIEAQRAYYKSQNDPRADLLPATSMTPTEETPTVDP